MSDDPKSIDRRSQYLADGSGDLADDERQTLDRVRASLGSAGTWAEPADETFSGLMDTIAQERHDVASQPSVASSVWMGIGAVAALLVVIVGAALMSSSDGPDPVTLALTGTELAPTASAEVVVQDAGGGLYLALFPENLDPAPEGQFYQAWMKRGEDLVSIGTFHAREASDRGIGLWSGVRLEDYPSISVTLQDEGGGTDSSGRVVLVGTASP